MTKLAAVIRADNEGEAERQARTALERGADLVELRLDYMRDLGPAKIRRLANRVGPRAIATLRSPIQGGAGAIRPLQRTPLLKEICSEPFAYADLELETDREDLESLGRLASRNRTKVIVSHHFVQAAEAHRVSEALESCTALGDLAKVAVPVPEFEDAIQLVDLARTWRGRPHPFVLIGMGVGGMVTRALADVLGQEIQYASWGLPATIGQLSLGTATRLRGREPMILGVIGHPIEHSISPTIHEAALAVLGLPAVYLPFDLPPDALDGFFLAAERLRIRGFNVTTPHKETVARSVDELDGDAERLGVVNTVVLRDGWTTGHNTIGALPRGGPWDLLVNATPAGTKGVSDGLPVPESVIGEAGFIYDLVYNPLVTPLLRTAKRLNRPGASGLEMLLHQGAKSFELWTGQAAPFDAMQRAAKEALR